MEKTGRSVRSAGYLFKIITDNLTTAVSYVAAAAASCMAIFITTDVVLRYCFNNPTKWCFEISCYLYATTALMAMAYAAKERAHIRIDFVVSKLPVQYQKWLYVVGSIGALLMLGFLFKLNLDMVMKSFKYQITSQTSLDIIVWPFQAVLPLGFLIFALQMIRRLPSEIKAALRRSERSME